MLYTAAYVNQFHLKSLLTLRVEFPIISGTYCLPFLVKVSEGFYWIIPTVRAFSLLQNVVFY
jgi:hypothetical protein